MLFDDDTVIFELENAADQVVRTRILMTDDENDGALAEATVDMSGVGTLYLQFSGFGLRADQASPRNSTRYEIALTNL